MQYTHQSEQNKDCKAYWLVRIAATMLIGTMLHAVPAWAVHFVGMKEMDVNCGSGMHLRQATGVPGGAFHNYAFGGTCDLRVLSTDGPVNIAAPPLVASAHWDLASKTYTESLHLLGATTVTNIWTGQPDLHLTTYPAVATFKCDVDPVIHRGAHCSLDSQYDDTGWHSKGNDQVDGFAWKANHNIPLLLGRASETQAASLSHKNTHPKISCDGLKLVSVHDMPKSSTRRFHFDGTCELYHTEDGSGGLRLTHVFVTGFWNAKGQEAQESFTVAAPDTEGGGLYRLANYTCSANPFIHGNVQCSLENQLQKVSPVYDPISDLRARHPIAAGMANPAQVAQLLKTGNKSNKTAIKLSATGFAHNSNASATRNPHVPKPKFSITGHAALTHSCAADKLVLVTFTVHDDAGFYHPAGGNLGYIQADEVGGAGLKSNSAGLPAMTIGKSWSSTLLVGTKRSEFSKLPGTHKLVLHIGPTNALKSSLAYVPPQPLSLTVKIPAGYCALKQRKMPNSATGTGYAGTAAKTGLPAVQQHANVRFGGKLTNEPALKQQAPAMQTMSGHINSDHTGTGFARESHKTRRESPHLKLLQSSESVDVSCANPAKFMTFRETLINEGGALAAGHARIYVKESGGAHIYSQAVPVPALAHGARTTLVLKAGTLQSNLGKIPGRHVLPVSIVVNGKTTTTKIVKALRAGLCQQHSHMPHRAVMKGAVKLNPQPEPPSEQRRLVIPK